MPASTHVFFTWFHVPSGVVRGGAGNVSVHFLTSLMLLSTRLLTWSHLSSGGVGGGVITSLCNLLTSSTLHTFLTWSHICVQLARTLDKCWDYCKDVIPNSVHTKNAKNKLLNAEIWNYVYQWKWRYNHRHSSWQMVPKVLKALCKWDVALASDKGKQGGVRYGGRYSVHCS